MRFHDLHHGRATPLLAQGVQGRAIMGTLGHSQIGLTMNTYGHLTPSMEADTAARMDAILLPMIFFRHVWLPTWLPAWYLRRRSRQQK
jgi:integrase